MNIYVCVCVFLKYIVSIFYYWKEEKKKGLGEISEIVCWVLGCVMSLSDWQQLAGEVLYSSFILKTDRLYILDKLNVIGRQRVVSSGISEWGPHQRLTGVVQLSS